MLIYEFRLSPSRQVWNNNNGALGQSSRTVRVPVNFRDRESPSLSPGVNSKSPPLPQYDSTGPNDERYYGKNDHILGKFTHNSPIYDESLTDKVFAAKVFALP